MLSVYGATGFTGQLVAELLSSRGVHFTLAGRNPLKLHRLRDALAAKGRPPPDIAVVSIDDRDGLVALARESRAILTCAGPFNRMGPPLVDAALDGGAHYLDITGEARFMIATAHRHEEAKQAGVCLVNAVGFDVIPSDLVIHLAAGALGGEPPERIDLCFFIENGYPSAGTLRTQLEVIFAEPGLAWVDGAWSTEPIGALKRRFASPLGQRCEAISVPLADVATGPRTSGSHNLRTYVAVPGFVSRWSPLLGALTRTLGKVPLARLAGHAPWTRSGGGPNATLRKKMRFAFVAEAQGPTGGARATISGCDPYGITAEVAAHAATRMLEPTYDRVGALSPMTAFDPREFRELLTRLGCRITVEAFDPNALEQR